MSRAKRIHLTKRIIDSLPVPPPESKVYPLYYDDQPRGLAVRVNKDGTKTFILCRRFTDHYGVSRVEKTRLGSYPDMSIGEAREVCLKRLAQSPADLAQTKRQECTIGELFENYMLRRGSKRKNPTEIRKCFGRWFSGWERRLAGTITRDDVDRLHRELGATRGRYSANRAVELLHSMYRVGQLYGLCDGINPASGIEHFTERPRARVVTADELIRFWTVLEQHPSQDFRDFVTLTLFLGMRKRVILSMRYSDIDFAGRTWRPPGESQKNGQPWCTLLRDEEIAILQRRKASSTSDYVFPSSAKCGHYVEPKRAWGTLLKRAQIADLHIHDLRRSLGTFMIDTGSDVSVVMSQLNHKDISTTLKVYVITAKETELSARDAAVRKIKKLAHGG